MHVIEWTFEFCLGWKIIYVDLAHNLKSNWDKPVKETVCSQIIFIHFILQRKKKLNNGQVIINSLTSPHLTSLTHSLTHLFTHSLTHSPTHPLTHRTAQRQNCLCYYKLMLLNRNATVALTSLRSSSISSVTSFSVNQTPKHNQTHKITSSN